MDGSLKQNLFWRSRISDYDIINIPAVERLADDINCHAVPIAGGEGADIILHLFIGVPVHWFDNGIRHLLIQKITDPNRCPDSRSHSIGLRIGGLCPVTDKAAQPHGPLSGVPRSRAALPHIAHNQDTAQ